MDPRIDVFCHILPKRYNEARWKRAEETHFYEHSPSHIKYVKGGQTGGQSDQMNFKVLLELDARFKMMDEFEGYRQVISVASPPVEAVSPKDSEYLAKLLNDEVAELVEKYPRYFAGAAASLPMNKPDAAAREMERCLKDLKLSCVQLFSNVLGKPLDLPEFRPIFQILSQNDVPILLHPARSRMHPDYESEKDSKFIIWQVFGWPYETTAAATRLAFGGVMDDFPNLKIILHHTGAMLPFFSGRVGAMYSMFGPLVEEERGRPLQKPPLDYFRAFYADVSTFTSDSVECARDFLGIDHILYGSDAPFDVEGGRFSVRESTAAIEKSRLSAEEKSKIYYKNFEKIFRQSAKEAARV